MSQETLEQKRATFAALVTNCLPDLSIEEMQFYTKNKNLLRQFLSEALVTQPKISRAIAYITGQEERDIENLVKISNSNKNGGDGEIYTSMSV